MFTPELRSQFAQDPLRRFYVDLFSLVDQLNQHMWSLHPPSDRATLFHTVASTLVHFSLNMLSRMLDLPKNLVSSLYALDSVQNAVGIEIKLKYDDSIGRPMQYFGWGAVNEDDFESMLRKWHVFHAEKVRFSCHFVAVVVDVVKHFV